MAQELSHFSEKAKGRYGVIMVPCPKLILLCQIIVLSFGIRITGVILQSKVRCHDNEVNKRISNSFRNIVLCLQLWLYNTFFLF